MSKTHSSSTRSSRLRTDVAPALAGAAAFVVSWAALAYVHVFHKWLIGDVRFYDSWGQLIAAHRVPYDDFRLEYPPGAIPAFAAPVYLRKLAGYHGIYYDWFRVEILGLGLLTVAAVAWALHALEAGRAHRYAALLFTGFAALLLGPIALARYDYWPALLSIVGVAALLSRRERLACAAIAAGFVIKIYPLVLLPLALIVLWHRRRLRGVAEGVGVTVLVTAAGFVPFLVLAPHGLWLGMWRQASRPLQVESLAASFWFAAHQIGGLHIHTVKSYGSDNLVTPGADLASTLSGVAVIVALARWLDGRVTAVIGTHTHVQTNDARVQPGGTAAITDAGMTGPHDSVIGVEADLAIRRMRQRLPVRFQPAEGGVRLEGVVLDCSDDGRASRLELLRRDC